METEDGQKDISLFLKQGTGKELML